MNIEKDTPQTPPVTQSAASADDDWDNVVFDDTEVPLHMGGGKKKRGKMATYGIAAVFLLAVGMGILMMLPQTPPMPVQTPASLVAAVEDPLLPNAGRSMDIGTVQNIDIDDLTAPAPDDPAVIDPAMPMPPGDVPAAVEITMDDPALDPAFAPIQPNDPVKADAAGFVAPTPPLIAPAPEDDLILAQIEPTDEAMAVESETGVGADTTSAGTPVPPATGMTQAEIDAQLEAQLVESLTAGTAQPPAAPPESQASVEEVLINNMDSLSGVPPVPNRAEALKQIEAQAVIRPTPENFYIVKQESAPAERNRLLMDAKRALNDGNNGKALTLFNELYEDNPNHAGVLMGRAVALQRMNRYAEALSVYEQVLRDSPENLEALTNMLGILSLQNPTYSVDKLQRLQQRYQANAPIKIQLALAYGDMGYIPEAISLLQAARHLEPNNPTINYNLAVMYDRTGDQINAAGFYRRAIHLARQSGFEDSVPVEAIRNRLAMFR